MGRVFLDIRTQRAAYGGIAASDLKRKTPRSLRKNAGKGFCTVIRTSRLHLRNGESSGLLRTPAGVIGKQSIWVVPRKPSFVPFRDEKSAFLIPEDKERIRNVKNTHM
jgi:molybdopterin biosynthesis enzyme MoaB